MRVNCENLFLLFSQNAVKLSGTISLVAHFGAAELATIFIPVSIREDQEQEFPDRHCTPALRTVEFSGLEFLEGCLWLLRPLPGGRDKIEWTVFHGKTFNHSGCLGCRLKAVRVCALTGQTGNATLLRNRTRFQESGDTRSDSHVRTPHLLKA